MPAGPRGDRRHDQRWLRPAKVTALHFSRPFIPMQLAATADRIWVLGTTAPHTDTATDCDLEEVTPSTMATRSYPIPACATDIAAAGGQVYLLASEFVPGTAATRQLHLEVFDPRTGEARVLSPDVMSIVGSGIAHTAFAAGDGALWLYGYQMLAGPQVVRISPQTGMVTATFKSVPEIGGLYPTVAADAPDCGSAEGRAERPGSNGCPPRPLRPPPCTPVVQRRSPLAVRGRRPGVGRRR